MRPPTNRSGRLLDRVAGHPLGVRHQLGQVHVDRLHQLSTGRSRLARAGFQRFTQQRGCRRLDGVPQQVALDERGLDLRTPFETPVLAENRLPQGGGFALDRADLDPEEHQPMQKRGAGEIARLTLVESVRHHPFAGSHFVETEPIELLVKIVQDRQSSDAVGDPAQSRADVDLVHRLEQPRRVVRGVPFAAARNQRVENVVEDRFGPSPQPREH